MAKPSDLTLEEQAVRWEIWDVTQRVEALANKRKTFALSEALRELKLHYQWSYGAGPPPRVVLGGGS